MYEPTIAKKYLEKKVNFMVHHTVDDIVQEDLKKSWSAKMIRVIIKRTGILKI